MTVITRNRKWADIRRHDPDSPGVLARGEAMKTAERLAELREARGMTQTVVAMGMGVRQPSISELERRDDAYLSTLRDYVEALGGRLRLVAEFDDAAYEIGVSSSENVGQVGQPTKAHAKAAAGSGSASKARALAHQTDGSHDELEG